jgi:hypothetical protein
MRRPKKVSIPPKQFVVISEEGYFAGLYCGGKLKWTFNLKEAKPLTNIEQFETIKRGYFGKEIILDFIK